MKFGKAVTLIESGGRRRYGALASCCALAVSAVVLLVAQSAPATYVATAPSAADVAKGKVLFKVTGCGKCHILKAAASKGTVGPNLDKLKLTQAKVAMQITAGGGFMPSFGGTLSKTKINQIAAFVYASEHKK